MYQDLPTSMSLLEDVETLPYRIQPSEIDLQCCISPCCSQQQRNDAMLGKNEGVWWAYHAYIHAYPLVISYKTWLCKMGCELPFEQFTKPRDNSTTRGIYHVFMNQKPTNGTNHSLAHNLVIIRGPTLSKPSTAVTFEASLFLDRPPFFFFFRFLFSCSK